MDKDKVLEFLSPYWTKLDLYVQHNTGRAFLVVISIICFIWAVVLFEQMFRRARRKNKGKGNWIMQKLKAIKARIVSDLVCEAVEECIHQGVITKKNAKFIYKKFGEVFCSEEFTPRKKTKHLKKEIRARLGIKDGDPVPKKKSQSKPASSGATLEVISAI